MTQTYLDIVIDGLKGLENIVVTQAEKSLVKTIQEIALQAKEQHEPTVIQGEFDPYEDYTDYEESDAWKAFINEQMGTAVCYN